MNEITAKDKPFNDIPSGASSPHKLVNHLFDQAHQIMLRYQSSIESYDENQANKNISSDRSIRLKLTAEDIEIIKQMLIRRISDDRPTDRSTDKLICQLKIQTNRLMVLLDEFDEEVSETQSDMKLDNVTV